MTNNGKNRLFRNTLTDSGSLSFQDVTATAGVAGEGYNTTSAAWGDYDDDGLLDLYVGNRGHGALGIEQG